MGDVTSGLTTLAELDATPPHLRVGWIAWDSPFRGSGLAVGDRIVGIDGVAITRPAALVDRQKLLPTLPGQYAEAQGHASAGRGVGSTLGLRVRRRAAGEDAVGWIELEIKAPLAEKRGYRDADNREVLGEHGPQAMSSDGFSSGSWSAWSDTLATLLGRLLDRAQHRGTFVSRYEHKSLRETHGERVAAAVARFPGAWSAALQGDYDAACEICAGRVVTLPPQALDFRRRGEELAARVRGQAQAAWQQFQAAHAAEIIPAFPAVNPVRGDVGTVAGKLVVLPPLRNADWVSEAGRGWFAAGGDGWYFLDAQAAPAQAMLLAQRRYTRLVDPNLSAQWEFVARITSEPRLTVVGDRAHFGLVAEPLAALVGGAMFVDLAASPGATREAPVPFAGEAGLIDDTPDLPPPDATPAVVLAALVGAVKNADLALWRALHASWEIERRAADGDEPERVIVHPVAPQPPESRFEDSRRSVLGRVLDAQVAWTDEPQVIARAGRFPGAEAIEEVEVWLDHVGEFDGVTRTFTDVTVRPVWKLQRIGQGPWRVADAQPI